VSCTPLAPGLPEGIITPNVPQNPTMLDEIEAELRRFVGSQSILLGSITLLDVITASRTELILRFQIAETRSGESGTFTYRFPQWEEILSEVREGTMDTQDAALIIVVNLVEFIDSTDRASTGRWNRGSSKRPRNPEDDLVRRSWMDPVFAASDGNSAGAHSACDGGDHTLPSERRAGLG
jgi:hypothetical protein